MTRLAEIATRRPGRVLAVWAAIVLVSFGLIGALLGGALTSDQSLTNNPESDQAQKLIDARLPDQGEVDEVIVVRSERHVVAAPEFARHVQELTREVQRAGAQVGPQVVSQDRHAALLPIVLDAAQDDRVADVIAVVERRDSAGFAAHITGEFTLDRDFTKISDSDLSKGELQFGLPAALIVLLLVVGTAVGAAVPMGMALISIVVALAITGAVGQIWELNLFITNMVVAMGLALGIDYSLFIVSRLREERHRGAGTRDAIIAVAGTATRAVVFSGTAFVLAMSAMLLVPDTTLRSLGAGAVIVGLVSILVALTFHPALLMVLGDRVDRLRVPWLGKRVAAAAGEEGPMWRRAVQGVMRRPVAGLVAGVAILLVLASPVLGLSMGAAGASSLPDDAVAKQGLAALQRDFPSGATDPVKIVVDGSPDAAALARVRADLGRDRDFAASALMVETGPRITVATVPLTVEPTSERASAAIDRLRDEYVPRAFGPTGSHVYVGGKPAEDRDAFAVNSRWLPMVIAVVLALSFVLLTLAFRSIAVAGTAIAVNLLSVAAAYGILVAVFQNGIAADLLGFAEVERIDSWVPIFLFSVLFGLSMDYQVFLLSRIHERWSQTGDTEGAIVHGVASTARLITGAAAIIIVVFTGFATGQLVALQEMGFGIAVALALDATLVRLLLIPAAMRLLGEHNWYLPRWLQWLPNLQVEGHPTATTPIGARPRTRPKSSPPSPSAHNRKDSDMPSHHTPSDRRPFPGWPWVAVALAFPIAGYIGWQISGPVDTVAAALIGGAITAAGLAAVQWWAAKGTLGRAAPWISSGAAGLAAGAALVGYDTDLGSLALMGLVSGASLGAAQGLVLAHQGRRGLAAAWAAAMPVLFGLGWIASTAIGVSVDDQFTVFGAAGALLFMVLSGLVVARFTPSSAQVA